MLILIYCYLSRYDVTDLSSLVMIELFHMSKVFFADFYILLNDLHLFHYWCGNIYYSIKCIQFTFRCD
ncbi:hypothetical protein XBO1_320002 [Xenorhabdus bovienii str. oregonense]|uniref:Uncharacterized protein n=1 Tax=Xenorhabdus bovienii str. oregonense TaxID=1398202 RepID=A0A077NZ61_XENBV|nr:hypothetical protein XBO1_320002 [Xenorhabdus bovienii str. oregonense]